MARRSTRLALRTSAVPTLKRGSGLRNACVGDAMPCAPVIGAFFAVSVALIAWRYATICLVSLSRACDGRLEMVNRFVYSATFRVMANATARSL